MATKTKTKATAANVLAFISDFAATGQQKDDSLELMRLMQQVSGFEPRMWGPTIIRFGNYHYKYASGHEGDTLLLGFSPRKTAISLYVFTGLEEHRHLLEHLGKFKMGKACIYVKKLDDINKEELKQLMQASIKFLKQKYPS